MPVDCIKTYFGATLIAAVVSCAQTSSKSPQPPPGHAPHDDLNPGEIPPSVDLPPGTKLDPVGEPKSGMATHFDVLGTPTGGCGVAFRDLDTPDFVALNVQHTPGDYTSVLARPIPPSQSALAGPWDNGRNCGRWILVTLGDRCTGLNDGQRSQPFCRESTGSPWVPDAFNGATLPMIVANSCQDNNAWCRDDRDHLDLATHSLSRFKKNDQPVGPLLPDHWGNRKISWQPIKAPLYRGDINIGLAANSNP